jgi:hypothetical protein
MKKDFEIIQKKYPNLSSAMCFIKLVKIGKWNRTSVLKWWNKLVNKDDYVGKEKREIIDWIVKTQLKSKP